MAEDAAALIEALRVELSRPFAERQTAARDHDLERAIAAVESGGAALDAIPHMIVDQWSLTSPLSDRLIAYVHRRR